MIRTQINFMRMRKAALALSAILIVVSLFSLAARGLQFGVDFSGGMVMEVSYAGPVKPDAVRHLLAAKWQKATVQNFGAADTVLIRLPLENGTSLIETAGKELLALLQQADASAKLARLEFVGPQVGEDLREQGGMALLLALAGIMLYVSLRFEFRFAVGAVVALVHDVIITLGFFSLFRVEFDLTVLAALLAIIGYSLNDTIVVFDRQRENFRRLHHESVENILNISVNDTLSRTILTSLTTLLVVIALYMFGSDTLTGFSLALLVGIIVGTYSSIYVASNLLLSLGVTRNTLVQEEEPAGQEHP